MGKISQNTIEQILAANDIVDVIGGHFPLKRTGATYKALCPFHQEKSPSFTVNPQLQIFKCFGCGAGGNVVKFVELYESVNFPEALQRLAKRGGITISETIPDARDDLRQETRRRLLRLHTEAAEWFHRNLMRSEAGKIARDYLKKRGLTAEVAKAWKLGFAPDGWEIFTHWARGQKFANHDLLRSGLVKPRDSEQTAELDISDVETDLSRVQFYDRFRGRLMFPICNDLGEVIAFSGRTLDAESQIAKYLNSPETMLFKKGDVLFGLHKTKRALIDKNSAIVCEGQIDLITAFEAGIQNVTAPQGTAFTAKQTRILKRYVEEVVLCFDSDLAGQKAAERSLVSLLEADLSVRVATMPANHDPDSLIREQGAEAFATRIREARDFFDFQIEAGAESPEFQTARGKLHFAQKIAGMAALIKEAVLRENVVHNAVRHLEIPAEDFRAMMRRTPEKRGEDLEPEGTRTSLTMNKTIALLCQLSLQDSAARGWLLQQSWETITVSDSAAELLGKILRAELHPDDANSINAFLTGIDPDEEELLSTLLLIPKPADSLTVIRDCWHHLQRQNIQRQQGILTARLREPKLSMEEIKNLQKEILDLQKKLQDITRLSAAL